MKNLFFAAFALLAIEIFAQELTITAPVADAKYKIIEYTISKPNVVIRLRINDAAENTKNIVTVIDNDTQAFLQAFDTPVVNEAGGIIRKREARVLKRLADAGLLNGVDLIP